MAKIDIFKQSIIIDHYFNDELDKNLIKILDEEEKNNKGVIRSNQGGFQTDFINDRFIQESFLKKSIQLLSIYFESKKKNIKVEIKGLWINKNLKNDYNSIHVHPNSSFSGVYYLKIVDKGGELVFSNNDVSSIFNENSLFFKNPEFEDIFIVTPQKNNFILFPSHLQHYVKPNQTEESRISVSFNIVLSNG
jgi:uncharacterized protein (TIGR02466 family)